MSGEAVLLALCAAVTAFALYRMALNFASMREFFGASPEKGKTTERLRRMKATEERNGEHIREWSERHG